jgi:hypothetical protein
MIAPVLTTDVANRNGRIYPKAVVEKALADALEKIRKGTMLGTLDYAPVSLSNASHIVADLTLIDDTLVAEIRVLGSEQGHLLTQLLAAGGVSFAVSGGGNIGPDKVVSDFKLLSIDAVVCTPEARNSPCVHDALMVVPTFEPPLDLPRRRFTFT